MGSVQHDVHDIGKDIVITMLRGVGFEVVDLGVDVPAAKFVQAVAEHKPQVVGMSVLLTTCFKSVIATVEAIRRAGQRQNVAIMVGGAAASDLLSENAGCDFYGRSAVDGDQVCRQRGGSFLSDGLAKWPCTVLGGKRGQAPYAQHPPGPFRQMVPVPFSTNAVVRLWMASLIAAAIVFSDAQVRAQEPPAPAEADWAKAMFDHLSHDFGVVARSAKVEYRFVVENPYNEDMQIESVRSSCGCSTAELTKQHLKGAKNSTRPRSIGPKS